MGPTASASDLEPAIALAGVRRAFDDGTVALESLDLEVEAGDFVALLGPSGCGKSTLLRLLAGLDVADAGQVSVEAGARGIGYVFQDAHLLPWRTVEDNVALPLELAGQPRAACRAAAREALAAVELRDVGASRPAELSGGMRMRVSIARALVTRPSLLLLDEPFAALDELTRLRLDERLRAVWREQGVTVLFVTHSIVEAAFLAERAVVFSRRPARVIFDERIELPAVRPSALRGEPVFARQTARLLEALERAEAT